MLALAAVCFGVALACPSSPSPPSPPPPTARPAVPHSNCYALLRDDVLPGADVKRYDNGNHPNLGSWNGKAVQYYMKPGCRLDLWSGTEYRGAHVTYELRSYGDAKLDATHYGPFTLGEHWQWNVGSIVVQPSARQGRRRTEGEPTPMHVEEPVAVEETIQDSSSDSDEETPRSQSRLRADPASYESFEYRDPLCEWILQDGLDMDWSFTEDAEMKREEIERLHEDCEGEFAGDQGSIDQCKFYVEAIAAVYDDEDLRADLEFDPLMETGETEYMHCGAVTVKMNNVIAEGKVSGIKIVKHTDGEDYFQLEAANSNAMTSAVVSMGAAIAAVVSSTLIKVCRDFHPTDYHWLLA